MISPFSLHEFIAVIGQEGVAKNNRFRAVITPPSIIMNTNGGVGLLTGAAGLLNGLLTGSTVSTISSALALGGAFSSRQLTYFIEATELPARIFDATNERIYGPSFAVPNNSQFPNLPMEIICTNDMYTKLFFDSWMRKIQPSISWDFEYRERYYGSVVIEKFDEMGLTTYAVKLVDAWPASVNPIKLAWADTNYMRLGVDFTYRYWEDVQFLNQSSPISTAVPQSTDNTIYQGPLNPDGTIGQSFISDSRIDTVLHNLNIPR